MPDSLLDPIVGIFFAAVFPVVAYRQYAGRRDRLAADEPGLRIREYRDTMLWLSGMGVATLVAWLVADRPWSALGLTAGPLVPAVVAWTLVAVVVVGFRYQLTVLMRDEQARAQVRAQLTDVDEFMPRTPSEDRWFVGVSFCAGIGEELFYRGFLSWWLSGFLPAWAAIIAANLAFAVAHAMHGVSATIRAGVLGLIFSGLFAWTQSLLPIMALHTAVDLFAGRSARASRQT